ncbi:disulfide bond formation protein B [Marinobacterium jannaschii]|uniref:disulfide bond formation protein B n=1 Tax=Marinobacterium jannaschii TaxID=64970 RepID=UPI0004878351|nr:disulfide bond formation protein B [Marinobacterium jannaschii]
MTEQQTKVAGAGSGWLLIAWLLALLSTLAALFIGEVMGQMPCTLCWYQRICMFPLALILGVAVMRNDSAVHAYAVPLALIGFVIAGYHSLLYGGLIEAPLVPCSQGSDCSGEGMTLFGVLPIPYLAVLAFAAITALLCFDLKLRATRRNEV